ncbi:MAG TPA: PrgI family protein [Candidatus Nanoarchaeia archaeon]|nr:PrgI family protein [Candidatus Nanoarchaeia archaeon]
MGQYKVPQDVEAEDTIIGPLTMRQFIYAVMGVAYGGLSYVLFKDVPIILILVGAPPTLLLFLLAFYRRQDQPFEAYFLALVNYVGRPKKRLWEKEPIEEVFKVEAPIVEQQAIQRNPEEVRGQLEQLARIVDSRGYAAKQATVQAPLEGMTSLDINDRERLILPEMPLANPLDDAAGDVGLEDDILDLQNNPSAQNLNTLIEDTAKNVREEAMAKMRQEAETPKPATPAKPAASPSISGMTPNPVAGILKLAMENDDLTVDQISNQANRQLQEGQSVSLRNATTNPSQ